MVLIGASRYGRDAVAGVERVFDGRCAGVCWFAVRIHLCSDPPAVFPRTDDWVGELGARL